MFPNPIRHAFVSFRYATSAGAALILESSPDGWNGTYVQRLNSGYSGVSESNVTLDLSPWLSNLTTVYLRFVILGSDAWVAIDDLLVDISYLPAAGTTTVILDDQFPPYANASRRMVADGRWWSHGSYWFDGMLSPLIGGPHDGWTSFNFASKLASSNLTIGLVCDTQAQYPRLLQAYIAPDLKANATLIADSNATSVSRFSVDVTPFVDASGFYFFLRATEECGLVEFNLTVELNGSAPNMPRGSFESDPIDAGAQVDWISSQPVVTLPPGAGAALWYRSSANNSTWSSWTMTIPGGSMAVPPGRFLQVRVLLWGISSQGLPSIDSLNISFAGFVDVQASADSWSTSHPMAIQLAPNASQVNWSGQLQLPGGQGPIRVRAFDSTGQFIEWNVTAGWDSIAPIAPEAPSGPGPFSNATNITWTWNATTDQGLGVAAYAIRLGRQAGWGDVVGDLNVGSGTSYTLAGATNGTTYYLSVRALDYAGNWGPWSNSSLPTLADHRGPAPGVAGSAAQWVNTSQVDWTWGAFVDPSGIARYQVRLGTSPDGSQVLDAYDVTGTNFSFATALESVQYYLSLRAQDQAGNWGPWGSSSLPVTVDLTPPEAPDDLAGPSGFANLSAATWSWTVPADMGSGVGSFEFEIGSQPAAGDLATGGTAGTTATVRGLTDGDVAYFGVRAVDVAGNRGPWVQSIEPLVIDTSPPGIPTGIAGPGRWINGTQITWQWDPPPDTGAGVDRYLCVFGTAPDSSIIKGEISTASRSITIEVSQQGIPVVISVRAVDRVGNVGGYAFGEPVSIDLTPPTTGGPIVGPATPSNDSVIEWSWGAAIDSGSGVRGYQVGVGSTLDAARLGDGIFVSRPAFTLSNAGTRPSPIGQL